MSETVQSKLPSSHSRSRYFLGRVVRKIVVLSLIFVVGLIVMSFTASRPSHLGVRGGELAAVPESPNCVSTMTDKQSFKADPINVAGIDNPLEKLKEVISDNFPRSRLVSEEGDYRYYEFSSLIFRFVDDTEFLYDEQRQVIDFRSGARVGHSDMGTNRKRLEKIRALMTGQ